jgi:hypothetical protein
MRKLITVIVLISFATTILNSCGGDRSSGGDNSSSSPSSNENKNNKIIELDTCINNSKEITEFLPNRVKKHEDICSFLSLYVTVGDKFYSNFYQNLNNQAEVEMDVTDMNKTNDEGTDAVKMIKGTYKSIKSLKKTTKGALKTAWSGKDLLELEDKRTEIQNKYSDVVLDSFQFAENAVNKYLYYSYVKPYKEEMIRIKSHNSIRTMPKTFATDQEKELKFNNTLEKFIALQKEGNKIRKVLVFNELAERKHPELVRQQVSEISTFWESEKNEYENKTELFKDFSNKIVEVKSDLKDKKDFLKNNKDDWNQNAISDFEAIIYKYEEAIKNEILNLEINEMKQPDWTIFKESKMYAR